MDIKKLIEKPHLIPSNTSAMKVLELFRKSPIHVALIIDEFGAIQGLVTFNDVLEAVIGDIQSRDWVSKLKVIKRGNNSFLIYGMLMLEELKELLKLESLPKEASRHVTLGGFIIAYFGKIPTEGDKFVWNNYTFEVMDMDGNRVDKVLVTLHPDKNK
ncbi:hypothetical protein A2Y99_01455 [Candidatus Gottesmanbacteria bacterium RBG_13_37_7]|uniref:CBS domain-containing protein n=1 Tax=Candidatus Gottesmanbacteria bacterium RBG_13_37_7 TaxID=1798369 RepID=A0A1F5YIU1_9BACT|nr:MAG: hypothetical protein A2Y99_01455 [Candidatus Gottesmanbacteria bacterium RBG_13_37_7]